MARTAASASVVEFDDDRLARAAGRGSDEAFELLYERLRQPVYGYCCSILRDRSEAEEALQETMLKAHLALQNDEAELRIRPWIHTVARNVCLDRIRSRGRTVATELSLEDAAEIAPSPEVAFEEQQRLQTLIDDMATLSERQRSALVLREMSGLSHSEIGQILGTTPDRVKSLLSEARQALADRALGREMPCETLRQTVRASGRRALHSRRLRAHLHSCPECTEFASSHRRAALAALAPALPLVQSRAILAKVLGASGSGGAGTAVALLGANKLVTSLLVAAVVGTGAVAVVDGTSSGSSAAPPVLSADGASAVARSAAAGLGGAANGSVARKPQPGLPTGAVGVTGTATTGPTSGGATGVPGPNSVATVAPLPANVPGRPPAPGTVSLPAGASGLLLSTNSTVSKVGNAAQGLIGGAKSTVDGLTSKLGGAQTGSGVLTK
jgi:RNA polymerase sigma factor (sigma-70 family)